MAQQHMGSVYIRSCPGSPARRNTDRTSHPAFPSRLVGGTTIDDGVVITFFDGRRFRMVSSGRLADYRAARDRFWRLLSEGTEAVLTWDQATARFVTDAGLLLLSSPARCSNDGRRTRTTNETDEPETRDDSLMSDSHFPRPPCRSPIRLLCVAGCGALLLTLVACSQQPSPQTPPSERERGEGVETAEERPEAEGTEEEPEEPPVVSTPFGPVRQDAPEERPPLEPPDGEWLTDDEGRQYFVVSVPKIEGRYKRTGENRVRLWHGIPYHVEEELEDAFRVKIYKVEPIERSDDGPSPEEIAAFEATMEVDLPTVDRLELTGFGRGLPESGQWRQGFDVADMNGDGHLDIVHGPPRKGSPRPVIFLGDGSGDWRLWEEAVFPPAPYDYGDVAAGDLNGDGDVDLILAMHLRGFLALVNDGSGNFTPWSEGLEIRRSGGEKRNIFTSRAIELSDWNGDGRPDLVALSEGPPHPKAMEREIVEGPRGTRIFLNRGDGSWSPMVTSEADPAYGDALVVADFDADGSPDVATSASVFGLDRIVRLGAGAGSLEPVAVGVLRGPGYIWGITAADFDGDGLDDLAVGYSVHKHGERWQAVDALLGRPESEGEGLTWERRAVAASKEPGDRVTALTAGDLDGDGRPDLVAGTLDGRILLYLGDGDGGFGLEEEPALSRPRPGCRSYHLRLADLDADGADELVSAFAGEKCPGGGSLEAWDAVTDRQR